MKVLVVCSGNYPSFSFEKHQAFIYDQMNAVKALGEEVIFETFFVKGKGARGYLKRLRLLKKKIKNNPFDIVHAHNSVIGLLSVLQNHLPVVVTFHGSDINIPKLNLISSVTSLFAKHLIFVSEKLKQKVYLRRNRKSSVIPCGVDIEIFKTLDKQKIDKFTILFTSSFNVQVKNPELAKKSVLLVEGVKELIELKGKSRIEVNELLNSVDLLLLTSFSEGSPQIIKEAMACNCPIVSTDVGDVKEVIGNTEGCYICSYDPKDVAEKIKMALDFARTKGRTNGRQRIIGLGLDNKTIAGKIIEIYKRVIDES